jgi:LPS-assembly protein
MLDDRTQDSVARGQVRINRMGNTFEGPYLKLNLDTQIGEFQTPTFTLLKNGGQGEASRVEFQGPDLTVAHDVRYSSCPRPPTGDWRPDWLVRAKRSSWTMWKTPVWPPLACWSSRVCRFWPRRF